MGDDFLKSETIFPLLASNAFDISLFESFLPLLSGGTALMLNNGQIKELSYLAEQLKKVNTIHAVPALMDELLKYIGETQTKKQYAHIRDLFIGGDKVPSNILEKMNIVFPNANIHLLYGPTESTIFITTNQYLNQNENAFKGSIIGKPNSDTQIYILDPKQQLIPKGVTGEICVGGAGLARGYLNQEELTQEKFVKNPFKEGERIYRTGDLGRWMKGGNIEFMGRLDDQVKIRGYRIELGEIEYLLLKIKEIEKAVVLVKENEQGEKEIVAYMSSEIEHTAGDLRAYLKKVLPDYMLPAYYVQLTEMPLSHNGKIDRKKLPIPYGLGLKSGVEYMAPRNEIEEKLVSIWEEVLQKEKIGIKDDFFTLGGHSLKALRLSNEYQKELGVKLSLKKLFAFTDIAAHVELIRIAKKEVFIQIEKVAKQDSYPISDAQRRLWVLSQFEEGLVAYNMPGTEFLNYEIDLDSFKKAINAVIDRHEILRTVFKENEAGEVRQWVRDREDLDFKIDYKDFRTSDKDNQRANETLIKQKVQAYIAEDTYKPFELENGPLLRASILQVADGKYVFYHNLHHIISDGWSMQVLSKDVRKYYEAYVNNNEFDPKTTEPKELRIQYKDYSAWQLAELASASFNEHKAYWTESLKGELPVLDLPSNKQRPRLKKYNGQGLSTFIGASTSQKIKEYSEDAGGSLFMGLLAVWNVLMYRYTAQKDVIIGAPTAGRDHRDLEDQIGFYVNTLALRNQVNPAESFDTFYQNVKENTLKCYDHQMYPFDRLVEELDLQRDTSRNAIFDVMLILQNNAENNTELDPIAIESIEAAQNQIVDQGPSKSKFDLLITFEEIGDYLSFELVYNTEVYELEMIEGLMNHFKQLLNVIVANPQINIGQIDYLTQVEKQNLQVVFNATDSDYPKDKTIADLFEVQALKSPNSIALSFNQEQLTYQELNAAANQFSDYLHQNYQIKSDDIVGLSLDRGLDYIVVLLGVLKAGACCSPINPDFSTDLLASITPNFKTIVDREAITLFKNNTENYKSNNPIRNGSQKDLAYVLYTSGSTGEPKGCMLENRGIVNHLFSKIDVLSLNAQTVALHASKMYFVGGIWQLWAPLLVGGKIVIPTKSEIQDISVLVEMAEQHNVRVLEVIPSQISNLFRLNKKVDLGAIEKLILTGEPLKKDLIENVLILSPTIEIFNTYGQTECSDVTTLYKISNKKEWDHRIVGRPIQNTAHYIFDENEMLCPIGVTGEIYTAGDGVSRGYLNQLEFSAVKFQEADYSAGKRVYKTGDLGRWTNSGEVEIIGRKDAQVKIRGYRIELGEIESALSKNKKIEEVVATALENEEGEKELVAYFTAINEQGAEKLDEQTMNVNDLRSYLKQALPDYMVPAYFVQLNEMPLTSNGKIDKKSLPNPKGLGLKSGTEYVAPTNELEHKLVSIWEEVLQKENIGLRDDFFVLGGHSLKAVRISNVYQKELKVKLALKDLFAHTTIKSHAVLIEASIKQEFKQILPLSALAIEKGLACGYPISDAQRRLWVLSQFKEGSVAYNMPANLFLNENIDIHCFKKAIDSTIERHEILRTVFVESETGEIGQKILNKEALNFKIDHRDFQNKENKQELVQSYINEDSYKSFDLENGPLIRAALLQIDAAQYVFYYNTHHIISDGWSGEVLSKDVFAYYEAFKANKPPTLEALRIQYKDYSAWQLNQLQEESFGQHKAYWLDNLSGEIPVIDLPNSNKRPLLKTYNGHSLSTYIDEKTGRKLKEYAADNSGSIFMGLLATWNILMYRYTAQKDIIIGTPVAGRDHADLENQIGFYVNTLALRNKVDPAENFHTFYEKIKENTLQSYKHQMYPFDRLVEDLNLQRDITRSAVFDVMVKLLNTTGNTIDNDVVKAGLNGSDLDRISDKGFSASKFDIEVSFQEMGDYLSFELVYNPDVYERDLMEGLIRHYKQLLTVLLEKPAVKIAEIDYLSAQEKQELLVNFNDTKAQFPSDNTIVDLFVEQALKTPDNTAIVWKEKAWTYKDVNDSSNQLAHYLQDQYQIQANDLVCIKLERNDWMLVSILGVLKSGGGYVPIDLEYPQERIDYIQKDANSKTCIDSAELNRFKEGQQQYSTKATTTKISENQLAYIIYTSGSTGKPKGVMITHKSASALIQWSHKEFGASDFEEVLFTTSINFDLSVFEIFHPLTSGKALRVLKDGLSIPKYVNTDKKLLINTVPSVVGELLKEGMDFGSVAVLNMAGEPIPLNYKKELAGKVGEIRNLYGPSEDTTYTTVFRVDKDLRDCIGKPIANTQIYILNEAGNLQAKGLIGEICIAGDGLAKGYLNQDGQTAEKFVNNPFKEGTLLYRTGDLGRWLTDGNLVFVGRKDDQVKIRGYRIELGEIVNALIQHEKIEKAIVIAKENEEGEKELVAYMTAVSLSVDKALNAANLRAYLKEIIPEYMLPLYYVLLDEIPLTSNGKVDYKSLPNPAGLGLSSGVEYIAPRNELEITLVEIWEAVLQKENIGVEDDFFTLGGHSLKAVRINNNYQKKLAVKLSLKDLFTHTTIASQAILIQAAEKEEFIQIEKISKRVSYPISDGQRRLWVLSQFEAGSAAYSISNSVHLSGVYEIEKLKKAINATIEHHEILRTVFKLDEEGEVKQWVINGEDLGFEIDHKNLKEVDNKKDIIQLFIDKDTHMSFDLENGPLIRACLFEVELDNYILYFNMHHIICDDWSMDVLYKDVLAYYEAYKDNREPALEPLRIQYKDYAVWQQAQLQKEITATHKKYWSENLSGQLPTMDLDITNKRPKFRSFKGGIWSTFINADLTSQLRGECQKNGGTLFHGILATWLILIHKYSGNNDLIIGTSVAGRNHADLERQIGFYSNSIALRNNIDPNKNYVEVLKTVIENTNNSMRHQDYPFNKVVEELGLKRESNRNPIFDTMLVHNNASKPADLDDYKGFDFGQIGHVESKAKFDLEISIIDMGPILSFRIIYDTDIFESLQVKKMVTDYQFLLMELLKMKTKEIGQIKIEDQTRREKKKKNLSRLISKK